MNAFTSLLLALTMAVLSACATTAITPLALSEDDKARILAEELAQLAPASQQTPKRPEVLKTPKPPDPLDRRITLTAGGIPLNLLLSRLADQAGLRLVTEREVAATLPA